MPYKASDTAKKLIALLINARDLSVYHSNRTLSLGTIESCKILCKSRNFGIEDGIIDIFDSLIYSIRSYKPEVLLEEFHKAEEFLIMVDVGKTKPKKPTTPELPGSEEPYAAMNTPID